VSIYFTCLFVGLLASGLSTFSESSVSVMTNVVTPPSQVTEVEVDVASPTSVRLMWHGVDDDGGMPVLGHLVTRAAKRIPAASDMVRSACVCVCALVALAREAVCCVGVLGPFYKGCWCCGGWRMAPRNRLWLDPTPRSC